MGDDRGALVGVPVKMSCTLNWENMLTIFSWKMAAMIRESKKFLRLKVIGGVLSSEVV